MFQRGRSTTNQKQSNSSMCFALLNSPCCADFFPYFMLTESYLLIIKSSYLSFKPRSPLMSPAQLPIQNGAPELAKLVHNSSNCWDYF